MFNHKEAVRYHVVHLTHYRYKREVTLLPHRLVVRPREWHDARLLTYSLSVFPEAHLEWSRDVYGNSIAIANFEQACSELKFHIDFTVLRRRDSEAVAAGREPVPGLFPVDYNPHEDPLVAAYRTPVFAEESNRIAEWVGGLDLIRTGMPSLEVVVALTTHIFDTIRYQRREERGIQTPEATLTLLSGSCRDKATLLMEALRHLGFAARFASGYLDCAATRAAHGSTHAWTEVYFPDLGWRGFDPTTGKRTTHQHIVTGVSHHPRGVMPVSGRIVAPPHSLLEMLVSVTVTPEADPARTQKSLLKPSRGARDTEPD